MGTDLSRKRFKPDHDFSGVTMQQGRVQLDSDWNEQADILDRRLRSETVDIVGRCFVPEETPDGFKIEVSGATLTIGTGRAYVHGLQAENHGTAPPMFDPVLAEERGSTPRDLDDQPYLRDGAVAIPSAPGTYLVYLEVWQREVTHLLEPQLIEQAVDVDTTARVQTAWQVKILSDADGNPKDVGDDVNCSTPDNQIPGWAQVIAPSDGRLSIQAVDIPDPDNPCLLPPGSGYKGLENHLYRVEIHDGGEPDGTATFKWSRDNGIVASTVDDIPTEDSVVVDDIGKDDFLRFKAGDWIEITNDKRELNGQPGVMRKIKSVKDETRTLTLESYVPAPITSLYDSTKTDWHTRVRRWDQNGLVEDSDGNMTDLNPASSGGLIPVPAAGTSIVLEKGVQVTFETAVVDRYHVADHWLAAARTADASVEELDEAPPVGIHRHHCRLALLHVPEDGEPWVTDCRPRWPHRRCCTITVRPGQDVQAAIDRIPEEGGRVCLDPGVHRLRVPLFIEGRSNLLLHGCGPGSKLIFDPDPVPEGPGPGVVLVVGENHNIAVESLSIYTDTTAPNIFIDEASAEVAVTDTVLVNVGGQACVVLGRCRDVTVQRSKLLGHRCIVQADSSMLSELAALVDELRPADDGDELAGGEGPIPTPEVEVKEPVEIEPVWGLRIADNDVLAGSMGIDLGDAIDGCIEDNRIRGASKALLMEHFQRPPRNTGHDPAQPSSMNQRQVFFDGLHRDFHMLDLPPKGADPRISLPWGIRACLLDTFAIRENRIWASYAIELYFSRSVRVEANNLRCDTAGIAAVNAFDLVARSNSIVVTPDQPTGSVGQDDDPTSILTTVPEVTAPGIWMRFARGARIGRNTMEAPEGIAVSPVRRGKRGIASFGVLSGDRYYSRRSRPCHQERAASLPRLLRIERPWRALVELCWLVYQIVLLLSSRSLNEERSKKQLEASMQLRLSRLFTESKIPLFAGKLVVAENRLESARYGVLLEQILTVGGARIEGNRVSGFSRTGIRMHPSFSVALPEVYARWIRCSMEWLLAFLVRLRNALDRFLEGSDIQPGLGANTTTFTATILSGFLALCRRLHGPADDTGDDPQRVPVDDLKDALDDLDLDSRTWLDDLLNQSYRVTDNTLTGSGTGIWVGIDGTRVADNRVTIRPGNRVGYEVQVLARLLAASFDPWAAILAPSLLHLDRDRIFAHAGTIGYDPSVVPSLSAEEVSAFSDAVAIDSPLRASASYLVQVTAAEEVNSEEASKAWIWLLVDIWRYLDGYGIVLVGGDMRCQGNRVDAEIPCTRQKREAIGALISAPAIGGIWHFPNAIMMAIDWSRLGKTALVQAVVALVALLSAKDRNLRIVGNQVEGGLVHGIRALPAYNLSEVDLRDNHVEDAAHIGIAYHLRSYEDPRCPVTVKVEHNTMRRSDDVPDLGFDNVVPGTATQAFVGQPRLIDVGPAQGYHGAVGFIEFGAAVPWDEVIEIDLTALVSHNHGSAQGFGGAATSAVLVASKVAGITANHILTDFLWAFWVAASQGLFTDNLADKTSLLTAALQDGPDVDNL
jgi:hypothetical protein